MSSTNNNNTNSNTEQRQSSSAAGNKSLVDFLKDWKLLCIFLNLITLVCGQLALLPLRIFEFENLYRYALFCAVANYGITFAQTALRQPVQFVPGLGTGLMSKIFGIFQRINTTIDGQYLFISLIFLTTPASYGFLATLTIFALFGFSSLGDEFLRRNFPALQPKFNAMLTQRIMTNADTILTLVAALEFLTAMTNTFGLFVSEYRSILRTLLYWQFFYRRYSMSVHHRNFLSDFGSSIDSVVMHERVPAGVKGIYTLLKQKAKNLKAQASQMLAQAQAQAAAYQQQQQAQQQQHARQE